MADSSRAYRWARGAMAGVLVASSLALCGAPYVRWAACPSLFDDDFLRVGSLRRSSLGEALFRPFNEHMAPLFELVSWVAWQASGRSVPAVASSFLVASYAAALATAGALGLVVRLETRSRSAALASVATFALSSVAAETVLWYSASSFQWAAAATLFAWAGASIAGGSSPPRRWAWLAMSAMASACAPAFSAIGILAGPLGSLRILSGSGPVRPARLARSAVPATGTAAYLVVCSWFRYGDVLKGSVGRNLDLRAAVEATLRAPASVLIPALIGMPDQSGRIPAELAAGTTMILLIAGIAWAARSRDRPLILAGLALIAGGYLATYATRARAGEPWIFQVQRYHLFPQVGLACLVGAAVVPTCRRLDRRPPLGLLATTGLAAGLLLVQAPRMKFASDWGFRFPDQPRAIAATLRLERACDREGITLIQAMAALEPIRNRWLPHFGPFNPLLHLFGPGPTAPRVPDAEVRPILIASMSAEDREALFGGMEATRYRMPASLWGGPARPTVARLVQTRGARATGEGRYLVEGWPGHVEYRVGPEADGSRALCLPGFRAREPVEVWWAGESGDWSPYRSARWLPAPGGDWAVALDLLPHWRRGEARRVRLVFHEAGEVAVGAPRFLP